MRAQGNVRFVKLTSRFQIMVASAIAGALALWLLITLAMIVSQYSISLEKMELVRKKADVENSARRVQAYKKSVSEIASDLDRRQAFLENIVQSYIAEAPANEDDSQLLLGKDNAPDGADGKDLKDKVSALVPEALPLARLEERQLAFARQLERAADIRAKRAALAIRSFGLNPDMMISNASTEAQGGPFFPFTEDDTGLNDPASRDLFESLAKKLARMDALERSLAAIPSGRPAMQSTMTSSFGYRRDPFTGRAAMHSGIDFKGAYGQPILAAATGKIIFAGRKSGYGNVIEIAHGNGLVTRYAHLSRLSVRAGARVERGDQIGAMGSTGRSTGTHLHFEVRQNDKAINPVPFLKAQENVLKIQAIAQERTVTND